MGKLFIIPFFVVLLVFGCIQNQQEKLSIGLQTTPSSSLVLVAEEKGFFEQNGLDIELAEFTAGKFALQAFLSQDVDFAVVGDVPVALARMQGNDFYVLTQMVESTQENPVLVHDEGISNVREYFSVKKRKLTTSAGGTPEFYTYNFLKFYNISEDQVEIVAQKPEDMVAAFTTNSVDAMSVFEPYPSIAETILTGKTRRFTIPKEVYSPLYVLVAKKDWVDRNPEQAKKFLDALIKAEEFIAQNPTEAKQIVAKRTKFSQELIDKIWPQYEIKAVLTEQLEKNWSAEAKWAIETNKVTNPIDPEFEKILRKDLLEKARN